MVYDKLNKKLTTDVAEWWKDLTKEEILEYIRNQPDLDADKLRAMFEHCNVQLVIAANFDVKENTTHVVE